jgi:superfamily II DNA or RNA helicase
MRDYQLSIVDEVCNALDAGETRIMLALSTGAGKTHIARELIRRLRGDDRQVLFVVDRLVLVEQAVNVFRNYGFHVGIIQAENSRYSNHDDVIVASVQSLPTREVPRGISMIFIDEAHLLHKPHQELLEHPPQTDIFPDANQIPIIGLSATPLRKGLSAYFNLLLRGPCIRELTASRYLVPVKAYSPGREQLALALASVAVTAGDYQAAELSRLFRRDVVIGDAIESYQQHGEKRPAIAFCVDQAHARAVTAEFEAVGIVTACILADTSLTERRAIVADFEAGKVRVLVSVAVLSAGFDAPHASCAILLRPTLSRQLHIQQAGRVLRSLRDGDDNELTDDDGQPVKQDALILDHAGNCTRHGLPEDFIVPDLSDETYLSVSSLRKVIDRLDTCGNCCLVMPEGAELCPACGVDRPVRRSNIEYLDGVLLEHHQAAEADKAEQKRIKTIPATLEEKKQWYLGYRFYCRAHGRKEGEAFHAYLDKFKEKPAWSWRDLDVVPPVPDVLRYARHRNIRFAKARERAASKGKQQQGEKQSPQPLKAAVGQESGSAQQGQTVSARPDRVPKGKHKPSE